MRCVLTPGDDRDPMISSDPCDAPLRAADRRALLVAGLIIAAMTLLRGTYAGVMELRTDEAYYWTWSKEGVLSYLDHPPMIAWFIRLGTAIFGDTAFGARFAGLLAMAASQLLLADIVRLTTRDWRAVAIVVLLPEAALYYGLLMTKIAPDIALIPFALGMTWALVRLVLSGDGRWWLAAGAFAGLAALSKLTAVMLVPAVAVFALMPSQRRWLATPWPWLAALIALALFAPVLIWNAQHDWASFRFQFVRASTDYPASLRTFGDFLGLQFGQVGPVLLPVTLSAIALTVWRAIAKRDAVSALLATSVLAPFLYFLWKSLTLRVGDTWPMFLWPAGFAAVAINWVRMRREAWSPGYVKATGAWIVVAIGSGLTLTVLIFLYYVVSPYNWIGRADPVGGEANFEVVAAQARADLATTGATWIATTDYRTYAMLRWYLKDAVPIVQVNQRARFIGFRDPGMDRIRGQTGLYVQRNPGDPEVWAETKAKFTDVSRVDRKWRGVTMDSYTLKTLTGWTPPLDPPPASPLYRWPDLAFVVPPVRVAEVSRTEVHFLSRARRSTSEAQCCSAEPGPYQWQSP